MGLTITMIEAAVPTFIIADSFLGLFKLLAFSHRNMW